MTRAAWVLIALLGLTGCADRPEGTSPALTPRDSLLADALATLQLADALAANGDADVDTVRARAYAEIDAGTGLDSLQIASALEALADDPERAGAVFALVTDRLQTEQRGFTP